MAPRDRAPAGWRAWQPELIVLAVALAVRALHYAGISSDPLFEIPRMDPRYHDAWALEILGGAWLKGEPFFRAPLYPYVLAMLYAASGQSVAVAKAAQLAFGALAPVLVVRIGRRTFGKRVGFWGGLVFACYPLALRFDGDLLLEGLFVLLVLAALLLELRTLERPSPRGWVVSGVVFGLAAITRPNILAYVVLVPLAHAWVRRRLPARAAPRPLAEALLIAAGVCLPIAPVAVHNWLAGDFVPIATQAGVNFYIGNNPDADGFTAIVPGTRATWWGGHDDAVELAEQAEGRSLAPSEVSDHWLREGVRFIVSSPFHAATLFLRKLYLFWWAAEISNNEHIYFLRQYSWPMRITLWSAGVFMPFGVLAPLGLVGLGLAIRRRPQALPLVVFVLAYTGSVVLFFVCSRFRYPIIPILVLFAVFAVGELARDGWNRRPLALLAALVVLLNIDPYGLKPAVFGAQALSYLDLGVYYAQAGDEERAFAAFERAADLDPGHPGPHGWMGKLHLRAKRFAEAEASLRLATRGDPVLFRDVVTMAQKDLGRVYLETGRPEAALRVFRAALSLRPDYDQAVLGVGYAARDLGQREMAAAAFRRVLEIDGDNQAAQTELEKLGVPVPGKSADAPRP